EAMAGVPDVRSVHDLHIWAMSTTETALTCHLTRPDNREGDAFLHAACEGLQARFGIGHVTLQVETGAADHCRLAPADVV
ncbi:MAG TPA: cation transporter, partial [Phenylobacterium sp.]|nr:cation transporter [Phenylobacterium sp.]